MTLSLCVVARNEARFITRCLASARGVVDEMVVVDTGSTDGTPDLARDAGARVFRRRWPGDLGAAHNLPLEYARGSWVLVLDADEVLDADAGPKIPTVIQRGTADGYFTPIRNYVYGLVNGSESIDPTDPNAWGAANYIPTSVVRLFRRRAAYRFSGTVHQSVAPAVRRYGGRLAASDILIHHYGLIRNDRDKPRFYRALARRQAAARPFDARAWIELGVALEHAPLAFEAFRRARQYGQRRVADFLLGSSLIELSAPALALPHLRAAARAARARPTPYFTYADACEQIAAAYEALGRPAAAIRAYERALASRPTSLVALNDLTALLIERGALRRARPLLDRLMTHHRGVGVAWATLALARLRERQPDAAVAALETALAIDPANDDARTNLGLAYRAAGRPRLAAGAWPAARAGRDVDTAGGSDGAGGAARLARACAPRALERRGVVSVIETLHGGAGRVLVDVVRALRGRPQIVLCREASWSATHGLRQELQALGVEVGTVASRDAVDEVIHRCQPACVIHHWWPSPTFVPCPTGSARWIVVGHVPLPMPQGYDAYVSLSALHRRLQAHVPPSRLHHIPNGVDLARFATSKSGALPVTIVMLARLVPSKFPRRLLAHLPPLARLGARVLIAGAGGRRYELEPEIAAAGLSRSVRFVGALRSNDVPAFLARGHIGLHLTEAHEEVCSMTILEMLASGLPIVAEPKGSLPEQIADGVNGFLADAEPEVAARLEQLIGDAALRRRMGQASRETAQRYRLERFTASWQALVAAPAVRARRTSVPEAAVPLAAWRPRLSYLVCDTPGSEAVCLALEQTGAAGYPNRWFADRGGRGPGGSGREARTWLARLIEEHSGPNGVFAAHVALPDLEWLLEAVRPAGQRRASAATLLGDALPGLRVVYVRWQDRVVQSVWAARSDGTALRRFEHRTIATRLAAIEREDAAWARFFATATVAPLVVSGERISRSGGAQAIRRLMRQLGIVVPRHPWVDRALSRPAPDPRVAAWADRFRRSRALSAVSPR